MEKNMTELSFVKAFIRLCSDGYALGFHERNGGNLTYRMTEKEISEARPYLSEEGEWVPMSTAFKRVQADNLAGAFFLTTGSGKFFRNVELCPEENMGMVEINAAGDSYRKVWGLIGGARPTSEFPTHFLNHSVRMEVTGGKDRVIYHMHPVGIIALSFVLPLSDKEFSRALWKSMTECPIIFPEGVGVLPWMIPGGADIAYATSELMRRYQAVVWAQHGLFVTGSEFDTAFGLAHAIEKAAQICLHILSTGKSVLQTIPDEGLKKVAAEYGVSINEAFLDL